MFLQPSFRPRFTNNWQYLDHGFAHIVKHSNIIADTKAVLRPREPSQLFDSTLALFGRLVSQVLVECISYRCANIGLEIAQVFDSLRGQFDFVAHLATL